jgi:oligopeptide transport system ATP-binding protein
MTTELTTGAPPGPVDSPPADGTPIIELDNLRVYFPITQGLIFQRKIGDVKAVDGVSLTIKRGETMGLVGESGSGKTTVGRTIMQLEKPTSGDILYEGQRLKTMTKRARRGLRRKAGIVFQDPYGSLNPRMSAGNIVAEPLRIQHLYKDRVDLRRKVGELFAQVGLSPHMGSRYPHEFSGGQRQRLGVARALAARPNLIVLDEPVSALDVSIQAQVVNLLQDLQEELNLTYLFIAHDLSVVRHISDRIAVMYLGKIFEVADRNVLYTDPLHPYTQALLSAVPTPSPRAERTRERIVLTGDIPNPANPPPGCVFNTRCPMASEECKMVVPELREIKPGHFSACIKTEGYGEYTTDPALVTTVSG